jgi:hypothetical protein
MHLSDPIHGFIEECCIVGATKLGTDKAVLYGAYVNYCEEVGAHPKSLANFTEDMQATYSVITVSKRRNGDAPQVPCYRNIRFNSAMAGKIYQTELDDSDDLGIGLGPVTVLKRDASGWPIPQHTANEFSALS